ncbi:uncharacterized protein LOC117882364 [Trachemys scripta elegans]|uniref:uncharacterized protein LOC117882364 n=1 Tax=Trachemys scripta elegans TaxID=31138 RepID=UPI001552A5BA|nr:uncharacterized protein LOC117882364 [Trachemys scripta elegans]
MAEASTRDSEDEEEKEERVDLVTEEAALMNIREQLYAREKDEAQQLVFLQAIYPACLAAQQRGDYTLEPHCSKAAVAERIVELIEELPPNSPPGAVLANSLIAVANLSTMTPALEPELETHLLQATLHAVFTLGTQTDTNQVQDLHRVIPDLLDAMLGNLLAKTPDTDKLHYILEQEVVTANIMNQLHIIRHLRQVPEALQEFCLQGHQQLLLPPNGECSETEWPPSEQESEGPSTRPLESRAYIAPPPLPVGWPPGPLVDSVATERPPSEREREGPPTRPLEGGVDISPPPSP